MSLFVKICGLSTAAAVDAAVEAGANAVGFVFFPDSPRQVTPEQAAALAGRVPEEIEKVAVFLRPQLPEVEAVLRTFDADVVQADADSLKRFDSRPVLPVLRSRRTGFEGRRVLFEGVRSGVGERADWTVAAEIARTSRVVLAGGLTIGNVPEAIARVQPYGVDVSSGVEVRRGVKDGGLIKEFIAAVRSSERDEVRA